MSKKCRDVMTENPVCAVPEDTVVRVAEIMKAQDVGPVPVVETHESKRLVGIVTDRDLALLVVATDRQPSSVKVSEVMCRDLVTCRDDENADVALDLMKSEQVRRILIVDEAGRLAGIIAQADVAKSEGDRQTGDVVEKISRPHAGLRADGR